MPFLITGVIFATEPNSPHLIGKMHMPSYRYQCLDCAKTHIGAEIVSGMICNCSPPKRINGSKMRDVVLVREPLSDALLTEVSSSEAPDLRATLCLRWGINNKSHKSHGSNFSSSQTVVNLIHDITYPVQGGLINTVRAAIIDDYRYDYITGEMVN